MNKSRMEVFIEYICPDCLTSMIGYRFGKDEKKWNYLYWYCENCGYKGRHALATIEEKPDCIHWDDGFCKINSFFRNHPKCMYSYNTKSRCEEYKHNPLEETINWRFRDEQPLIYPLPSQLIVFTLRYLHGEYCHDHHRLCMVCTHYLNYG